MTPTLLGTPTDQGTAVLYGTLLHVHAALGVSCFRGVGWMDPTPIVSRGRKYTLQILPVKES